MRIREHPAKVLDGDTSYTVRICDIERSDGTWEGWLEFHPASALIPSQHLGAPKDQDLGDSRFAECLNGLLFAVVYVENGEQFRDLQ